MTRLGRLAVVTCVLFSATAFADATQDYRAVLQDNRPLFNTLMMAEKAKKEGSVAGHLGASDVLDAAEKLTNRAFLDQFIKDCKAGKYRDANEPSLRPARGCELAEKAPEILGWYMDEIAKQALKGAGGNARANLEELKNTGCVASFEAFYLITQSDPAQARTSKQIADAYAKAGRTPPPGAGDNAKDFEAAVDAAIAKAEPSKPSKKDAASEKLVVAEMNKLCKSGVKGKNPRNCTAAKAWMTTDDWNVFKNELDIPKRRTREAKVLIKLADRKHCIRQHMVVAQEYTGKWGPSTAELGQGACPVPCK